MGFGGSDLEAWLREPLRPSPDPRFEVRRAILSDFDRIFDVVDQAFARPRPRAFYEWLYRRNPFGVGRCLLVYEKRGGRMVGTVAMWPWPMACGAVPLPGFLEGDSAVLPEWQRMGVTVARRQVSDFDPQLSAAVRIAWPNQATRGSRLKGGPGRTAIPVPRAILVLDPRRALRLGGWAAWAALAAGSALEVVTRACRCGALYRQGGSVVEEVQRFDGSFDDLSGRCLGSASFWCPRTSAFLNWRYVEHPTRTYVALAVFGPTGPDGYGVLRLDGAKAVLMELVAPAAPARIARAILARAVATAREAGCVWLECIAPPHWLHWPLFRSAGFSHRPSDISVLFLGRDEPGVDDLDNWLLSAGDMDAR
jgi:GNAT superfamily N-acetyltransferase